MSIQFAQGVADRIRTQIAHWGIQRREVSTRIFAEIEAIDSNPEIGTLIESGVFDGLYIHRFRIDFPPIVLNCAIVYDVILDPETFDPVIQVLDFNPTPL